MNFSSDAKTLAVSPESSSEEHVASGVFTWVLATNMIYADEAAAALFGFSRAEAEGGLPLEAYRSRIHPDDVGRYSEAAHRSVITGVPFQLDYRACWPDGTCLALSGFGACFRDAEGAPQYCAGMMVPIAGDQADVDPFIQHILAALDLVKDTGEQKMTVMLAEVLSAYLTDVVKVQRH